MSHLDDGYDMARTAFNSWRRSVGLPLIPPLDDELEAQTKSPDQSRGKLPAENPQPTDKATI